MGMSRRNAEADLQLPPGFRFFPTDEELVVHYLCKKAASQMIPVPIIAEVDLYKYDPWQLPEKALFGEKEWYFFTPRDRKYPNGSRPNRAAGTGYWKATGADKPISAKGGKKRVGIKKALVFYAGKAPKGTKTNWIMHEYRLADVSRPARKKGSLRLDDWVLCRIYNKKISAEKLAQGQKEISHDIVPMEAIDEKDMDNQPSSTSIEHSGIEQNNPSSGRLMKLEPSPTSHNVVPPRSYPMNSNFNLQNPDFFQNTSNPFNASTPKAPVQNTAFNPISPSIDHQWANYNSADLVSGLHTDSSSSKPSSSSDPISEKEEVQSSFRLENFLQEQPQPTYNFSMEGLQNPFPQLDQITFLDFNQDYFTGLTTSDYLPRFNSNDIQFQ